MDEKLLAPELRGEEVFEHRPRQLALLMLIPKSRAQKHQNVEFLLVTPPKNDILFFC